MISVGAEPLQDRVEQDHAGRREVRAPGIEPRDAQPLLERLRQHLLAHAAELLGRDAPIAQRGLGGPALGPRRHGAEARDGPGGANDAIEPGFGDTSQVLAGVAVDALDDLPGVARRQRIALDVSLREADDAELEALPELDVRAPAARDLDAAAADVDDDGDIARAR